MSLTCIHLGTPTGQTRLCPSCRGGVQVKLFGCAVHGQCTQARPLEGVACCKDCPDHRATPLDHFTTRNLLYFICPMRGNGIWQRNVLQLLARLPLFNGKRIIAVAQGPELLFDPVAVVRDAFGNSRVDEWLTVPNDRTMREMAAWPALLERVESTDPAEVTFTGHAKGVTKPTNPGVTTHAWAEFMYQVNLDYWPWVEEVLRTHSTAGAFLKTGVAFRGSKSGWHYSGTFYWFRNRELFGGGRDWRKMDTTWWGTESYPGLHWTATEAGCLFHEAPHTVMNLYRRDYMDQRVIPEFWRWRETHEHQRTWALRPDLDAVPESEPEAAGVTGVAG